MQTVLNVLSKVKSSTMKVYSWSPFMAGALVGFFGKSEIQLVFNIAVKLMHKLVG